MPLKIRVACAALIAAWCVHSAPANDLCSAIPPGGTVDGAALANLLASWTGGLVYAPCPPFRAHDFNKDCRVNGLDLGLLLANWGMQCNPVATELAGNPLTNYPFFEYIKAVNQNARLRVAIDPTRFPGIVGQTCRVYVVDHKSIVAWQANPALADVTAVGFQVNAFVAGPAGGQIQANTIEIDPNPPGPAHGLSGQVAEVGLAAGSGLGRPFDVVFDCNQNGKLDAADYIDGFSATEAGFYVTHDVTQAGPYAVTPMTYNVNAGSVPAGFEGEQTFYPNNIAGLGQLPLVVISHGNGHDYTWYGHIGMHLSSYGYIVMSHQCNTPPGPQSAAATTIRHTNAIIAQQAAIPAGHPVIPAGVLNGHIDATRIVWIGHSRGAEGVVIAYDHIADGTAVVGGPYAPAGWNQAGLKLISSIAPTDFYGPDHGNPHGANYHVWTGAADDDVDGCAVSEVGQTFHFYDRGTGNRQSTSLYGAGHGDFHNNPAGLPGDTNTADGPCLITRAKTHLIVKGYLLPLVKRYVNGNTPARDFLCRQWERFKPIGAPAEAACAAPDGTGVDVVVNLMYKDAPAAGNRIIDDFQTNPAPTTASSGAGVAPTVTNVNEGRLDDNNADFVFGAGDPMNGMTAGGITAGVQPGGSLTPDPVPAVGDTDQTKGVVFDWAALTRFTYVMPVGQKDFTPYRHISFRACQGTRHANTTAALEDLTFNIRLEDVNGVTSAINISAYGGGVEEPYQRTGCGAGAGWANEFEVIRLRLTDFLNNASNLDLTKIDFIIFEFAAPAGLGGAVPAGSPTGRIGLDDVELTKD